MTPEHNIQNKIRLWLCQNGYLAFRCNVGRIQLPNGRWFDTGLPNGFSDLLVLDNSGHTYFIECKAPKGHLRPDQENFKKIVTDRGFKYIIARSIDDIINSGL